MAGAPLAPRPGITDLVAAGPRAVARYTGTLLTVFVTQTIVAIACMLGVAVVLSQAFAHLPMFDDAVDGDLVSLMWCLRYASANFAAAAGIVFAAVLLWQLAWPLLVALAPALVVLHLVWTISDYARVELTLRHDSHDPGVIATYLRSASFVVRHPSTLLHAGLGWLAIALVMLGYAYLAYGHPMYGAEGAITLFVIRQGVALARTAIRVGVLAGQLELGRTRPLPPRRVEVKVDSKV